MILMLVITDVGAYGVYVKRHQIVESFPVQPVEKLIKIIGKRSHIPLVICWDLSVLYVLRKNTIPLGPQLLRGGHGKILYATDQQGIELWITALRHLKNPLKAMALVQKTSGSVSLQTPVYAKALQTKVFHYWLRRLVDCSRWILFLMALVSLGVTRLQYTSLLTQIKQGTQHLEQLEKTHQLLKQQIRWSEEFCRAIETVERKINGNV